MSRRSSSRNLDRELEELQEENARLDLELAQLEQTIQRFENFMNLVRRETLAMLQLLAAVDPELANYLLSQMPPPL